MRYVWHSYCKGPGQAMETNVVLNGVYVKSEYFGLGMSQAYDKVIVQSIEPCNNNFMARVILLLLDGKTTAMALNIFEYFYKEA